MFDVCFCCRAYETSLLVDQEISSEIPYNGTDPSFIVVLVLLQDMGLAVDFKLLYGRKTSFAFKSNWKPSEKKTRTVWKTIDIFGQGCDAGGTCMGQSIEFHTNTELLKVRSYFSVFSTTSSLRTVCEM